MSAVIIDRLLASARIDDGLIAYLEVDTVVAGLPDQPVPRRVQLFVAPNAHGTAFPSATLIATQVTDAAGRCRFEHLDPALRYGVIAYDHTGEFDPVIKTNLIPSVP
mgnify:CR=1 FL=1